MSLDLWFVMIASLSDISLIAILRGVHPHEVLDIAKAIYDAGWNCIEVPLNSPLPFESLKILQNHFGDTCLIGAGTVLTLEDVHNVHSTGAKLIVSPNCNADIIQETKRLDMFSIAGIFTPTEAFHALSCKADALKLFPGEIMIPFYVKAMRAVLPQEAHIYITGGVGTHNMQDFYSVGANGFGVGGLLYKPNDTAKDVGVRAKNIIEVYNKLT